MAKKTDYIEASTELIDEIAREFEVTQRTVRSALNFETNSPSARMFRAYALNHGAEQYKLVKVKNPYEKVVTIK